MIYYNGFLAIHSYNLIKTNSVYFDGLRNNFHKLPYTTLEMLNFRIMLFFAPFIYSNLLNVYYYLKS